MTTSTTSAASAEVSRYLDAVRAHLDDLPAEEREDLLDDLAVHLAEVSAETDEPLEQALGSPHAFAAELLASSGHQPPERPQWRPTALWSSMRTWGQGLDTAAALDWVRTLLPELVPGWWVLRAYLAVLIVADLWNGVLRDDFPVPRILGSPLLGLLAIAGAVVWSVHLGRRVMAGEGPRWVRLVDIAVVLGALVGLQNIVSRSGPEYVYVDGVHETAPGALTHPDGTEITNLFAYDADGRLLDGVLVYDQDGTPVMVAPDDGSTVYTDDGEPLETDYRLDVNGAEVRNAYPLDQVVGWADGPYGGAEQAPVRPPAITAPRLAPDPDTATSPTSTTVVTSSTSTIVPPPEATPGAEAVDPPPPSEELVPPQPPAAGD